MGVYIYEVSHTVGAYVPPEFFNKMTTSPGTKYNSKDMYTVFILTFYI